MKNLNFMKYSKLLAITLAIGLVSMSGLAYRFNGYKWAQSSVTYYVNPSNADEISSSEVISDTIASADAWSVHGNIRLSYGGTTFKATMVNDRTNNVFFSQGTNGGLIGSAYWWYSGGSLVDFDIALYDPSFQFHSGESGCSGGFYLQDILTHEFGHGLGLDHSDHGDATMYPTLGYCNPGVRSLASDDINGIQALYPPVSGSPPVAPTGLYASLSSETSVSLSWQDRSADEAGFDLERSQSGGSFQLIRSLGVDAVNSSDASLQYSTSYSYRVRAYNKYGSSYSNIVTIQTSELRTAPQAPSLPSPTNFASGIGVEADLAWAQASGADSYNLYFGTNSNPFLVAAGLRSNSYSLATLGFSTTYYWRVEAVNAYGVTSSSEFRFSTKGEPVETIPTPPTTGLTLSARAYKVKGLQRVDLSFSGSSASSIDIYRNGSKISTIQNTGRYTDVINSKGGGSYNYKVCEADTSICSALATTSF